MVRRALATGLLSVSLLLASCAKQPAPAPAEPTPPPAAPAAAETAAAPVAAPAASPAVADAETSKADAKLENLTQLTPQDQLPGGRWQAGKNYQPIVPAQPTNVPAGKVEVVEVFWFGCPHCLALEPFLQSWQKSSKPAFVEFVRVPVTWQAPHKSHARFFYTLQALGHEQDLFEKAFDAVQKGGDMLLGDDDAGSEAKQAKWAASQGIDADEFSRAYHSFGVNASMQRAEQLVRRYSVTGVPTVVVNGKFLTDVGMAGGQAQLIQLLNDLATAEKRR